MDRRSMVKALVAVACVLLAGILFWLWAVVSYYNSFPRYEFRFHPDVPVEAWRKIFESTKGYGFGKLDKLNIEDEFPHLCRRIDGDLMCGGEVELRGLRETEFYLDVRKLINFQNGTSCDFTFETKHLRMRESGKIGAFATVPYRVTKTRVVSNYYYPNLQEWQSLNHSPERLHRKCSNLINDALKSQ